MRIKPSALAAWLLPVTIIATTTSALAQQIPPFALAATGQVGGVALSPASLYLVGANPIVWAGITATMPSDYRPYSEGMRQLLVRQPLRLNPPTLPATPPAEVFPNSYTQAISFGDSMSDTGNLLATMLQLGAPTIPPEPNHQGRFSDGVVVVEAMTNALNLPLVNYAFAGARSGNGNLVPVYALQQGMLKQIQDFLSNQASPSVQVDANALYVIWTGPDDYYADGNIFNKSTGTQIANNINKGMTSLYARGARHFFVPLMPDLSITPSAHEHNKTLSNYLSNAQARSAEFATLLTSTLKAFAKQYPQAKVHTFDMYTYSQQRMVQAAAEGNNVTEPCYIAMNKPICARPDKYLFWDTNHPTAAGSTVIGTDFAKSLVTQPALPSR